MSSQTLLLSLAILSSSFWGSWHCATMCSPIASLAAVKKSLWLYHLGRLLSYVTIGAVGGYLGSFFLTNELYLVRIFTGVFFAIIVLWLGIQSVRGKNKFLSFNFKWLHFIFKPSTPVFLIGLLSVFLPCGWLYSYVLAGAATRSISSGMIVMSLFWLGGLPALSSVSMFVRKSVNLAPEKKQKISGYILVFAALYALGSFYFLPAHSF